MGGTQHAARYCRVIPRTAFSVLSLSLSLSLLLLWARPMSATRTETRKRCAWYRLCCRVTHGLYTLSRPRAGCVVYDLRGRHRRGCYSQRRTSARARTPGPAARGAQVCPRRGAARRFAERVRRAVVPPRFPLRLSALPSHFAKLTKEKRRSCATWPLALHLSLSLSLSLSLQPPSLSLTHTFSSGSWARASSSSSSREG